MGFITFLAARCKRGRRKISLQVWKGGAKGKMPVQKRAHRTNEPSIDQSANDGSHMDAPKLEEPKKGEG